MYSVDIYSRVRRACLKHGMSVRPIGPQSDQNPYRSCLRDRKSRSGRAPDSRITEQRVQQA